MFKSCSRCGKIHLHGQQCYVGNVYRGGEERQMRGTYAWKEKRKEIRERANHLCEVCRDQGEITYDDIEVHHIIKIRDDRGRFLENENLICLCKEHHKQADNGELATEYLFKLARDRELGKDTVTESA